ncbi:hypothetical protein COD67_09880 [Bacillus cereus]|nr:hypothetical protein COD67_09880 [Bacillus cereus]
MEQLILPLDYSNLIPKDHVVRVIHEMVEQVSDELFFSRYQGGGRSSYHPKIMTKVILYAYTQKIYSCRDSPQLPQTSGKIIKPTEKINFIRGFYSFKGAFGTAQISLFI